MVTARWAIAPMVVVTAACELQEVTEPAADTLLVVQAVINTGEAVQFVIVENSLTGARSDPNVVFPGLIPNVPARFGLSGARVTLTHLDPDASCTSPTVLLAELEDFDTDYPIRIIPSAGGGADTVTTLPRGAYVTTELCALHTGDRVALDVEAPDGRRVTGHTRIPGFADATIATSTHANGTVPFRRDRDSLWVTFQRPTARALQVDVLQLDHGHRDDLVADVPFSFLTDTMGAVISGLANRALESDLGRPVFHPGRYHVVTAGALDTNYYDYARSGGELFTGRGFINHLVGGVGVFGSVRPHVALARVTGPRQDPREAVYRITGSIHGDVVDVLFEPYLDIDREPLGIPGAFSAFFDGMWRGQPIETSVGGAFDGDPTFPFGIVPLSFSLQIDDAPEYYFVGSPGDFSSPFVLNVRRPTGEVGQLVMERTP